ncbi:MAG: pyridoxal phosphate-dependent aminotransferase [Planctomycetota bacterium]|nr:pyridoxal phosphate-dependent aminotransferase [Planctomycetota bacterium]
MEWVKARAAEPRPTPLHASGALPPAGEAFKEWSCGHTELERRIASRYGVRREQVYLLGGTSLANFVTLATLAGRGSRVAVETPGYHALAEIPRGLGAKVVDLPRMPDGRLPKLPAADLLVLTSPHNPTGWTLRPADWRAIERWVRAGRKRLVVVDEVYRDLQSRPGPVAAKRHPRFVTTGSLTKAYGLGALRVGWALGAPKILAGLERVDNLISVQLSTPGILAALRAWPRLDALKRKALKPVPQNLRMLRASGLEFIEPDAGLTALVCVGDGDAVSRAAEKQGVLVIPGSLFGAREYVRVFLGAAPAVFRRGIEIISAAARKRPARRRGATS